MSRQVAIIARRLIEAAPHGQMEPGKRNRFVLPGSICPYSWRRITQWYLHTNWPNYLYYCAFCRWFAITRNTRQEQAGVNQLCRLQWRQWLKTISVRSAAAQFDIPYPTLLKHIIKGSAAKSLGRFRRTFSESYFYGLTKSDLKSMAFQLAERNHLHHPFKNDRAGDQWVADFIWKHQNLSLRTPETTSIARS